MRRPSPAPSTRSVRLSRFFSVPGSRLAPGALAAVAVLACGGDDGGVAVTRADSAGVEIVTSPAADRPLGWTLEEEFRLGGMDEGPQSFVSVNFDEVGADADGDLYVLDRQSHRVVVFGPDGSHLRSMGSEGEGPGELRFPVSFAVRGDGTAAVFDIGKGSMVFFGPDGGVLPQHPFTFYTEPGTLRHFALTPEGYAVARGMAGEDDDLRKIELRAWPEPSLTETSGAATKGDEAGDSSRDPGGPEVTAPDTVILTELRLPNPDMADFGCMRIALQPLFTPVVQWDSEGSTLVATSDVSYRVDVFDLDGTHRRSIRRDLPFRIATEAQAVAEAGTGMRMRSSAGTCEATPAEVVEARGYASQIPAIRNVLLAPSGELWVARLIPGASADGTPEPIDVFDPTGAYLGTLPEGTPFPLLLLPDGRVAYAEKDALDVERLVIARVERRTSSDAADDGSGPGTAG